MIPDPLGTKTVQEAAQVLRFHPRTVYRLIRSGRLKPIPGEGDTRIADTELYRFINGDTTGPTAA